MPSQIDHLEPALPRPEPDAGSPWLPVRRLHEGHRPRILAHLTALEHEDRTRRFGHAASDDHLRSYVAQLDFAHDEVLGVFNRQLELVALAHLAALAPVGSDAAQASVAELGLSVSAHLRGRGLGRQLMDQAMRRAQLRGVARLVLHLARDNLAMRALVTRLGAELEEAGADLQAAIALPGPTLGSAVQTLLDAGAADLDYRLKLRVLRLRGGMPSHAH